MTGAGGLDVSGPGLQVLVPGGEAVFGELVLGLVGFEVEDGGAVEVVEPGHGESSARPIDQSDEAEADRVGSHGRVEGEDAGEGEFFESESLSEEAAGPHFQDSFLSGAGLVEVGEDEDVGVSVEAVQPFLVGGEDLDDGLGLFVAVLDLFIRGCRADDAHGPVDDPAWNWHPDRRVSRAY